MHPGPTAFFIQGGTYFMLFYYNTNASYIKIYILLKYWRYLIVFSFEIPK